MKLLYFVILFAILTNACTSKNEEIHLEMETDFTKATAVVYPIGDSGVEGIVNFEKMDDGVSVKAEFSGLEGENHGFHIHQFGDCSAVDGTSAGGHFNPYEMEHSNPDAMSRHMGDMGNLTVVSNGVASKMYIDSTIDINQIVGRGIIVHAGEDDLSSQPSGAAGSRIACGVIGIAK